MGVGMPPQTPLPANPGPVTSQPPGASVAADQLVDPALSRLKFDREVAACRAIEADYRRRGWWILSAEFPNVVVAFVAPQLRPAAVIFGARINFDNYDLWAPSVRLVDPFTSVPLRHRDVPPTLYLTRRTVGVVNIPGLGQMEQVTDVPLLQAHGPDELPFFCIPGVREYHENPAHSGDDWLLHRGQGEGTLHFLLEKLARYGLEPIQRYQLGLHIAGVALNPEVPT